MSSKEDPSGGTCRSIVTQMYTFSTWSKPKAVSNGHVSSSMLPYVGFPGLSLTPIPENPLLDPSHNEDSLTTSERDRWLAAFEEAELLQSRAQKSSHINRNGSLPKHWLVNGTVESSTIEEIENENGKDGDDKDFGKSSSTSKLPVASSSCATAVNVHVVHTTTFLPKEGPQTREEKRAHTCKLLLFALCGFVMVAGIILWIFSPAFT